MPGEHIVFEPAYCTGCTQCVKACPTRAIRVRRRKAVHSKDLCIGCGECIRVCPEGAVRSTISHGIPQDLAEMAVAIVSPILYAQFPGVMPSDILVALKRFGFHHVVDLTNYVEMFQFAVEEFIHQNKTTGQAPWPLISPICPVIARLIAFKYPNLLPHIIPLKRPAALIGGEIRSQLQNIYHIEKPLIELYHITPCPSKALAHDVRLLDELGYIDRAIGINDIYPELIRYVEDVRKQDLDLFSPEHYGNVTNARAPLWGMSGGEIAGMHVDKTLAVSGLRESIAYIEKIEMGLFPNMEYIELRACPEGCLGGPLTAVDRYLAKSTVQQLIRSLGLKRRLPREKLLKLYDQGRFMSDTHPSVMAERYDSLRPKMTIEIMKRVEHLLSRIQGTDCAACGAPDCRTFAEDVVRGQADPRDCFRLREKGIASEVDKIEISG